MKFNSVLTAVAASVVLSACGGGGGGSSSPSTGVTQPTTPPVVTPSSDLQTSVPALTYAAGSQEEAFVNAYNEFRAKLGMGKLAQDTRLDLTAQNGLKYQAQNTDLDLFATDPKTGRPLFHIEDPARPGFTGVTELERAKFAQYPAAYVGESGSFGLGNGAVKALDDLINTVYHRSGLMFQFPRDIGVAVGTDKNQTIIMEFGYQSTPQYNAKDYFGVYPADKQTGVPLYAAVEVPNPMPDVDLADYTTRTSSPINVVSERHTTLVVTSFTVTEAGASAPLNARVISKANDPNNYLETNVAFVVASAPFKSNTTYNVSFVGTIDGAAVSKKWSFTTK